MYSINIESFAMATKKKGRNVSKKGKLHVKPKLYKALQSLRHMKPNAIRSRVRVASKEFVKDVANVMSRLRKSPHLVPNPKDRRKLLKHRKALRRLTSKSPSVENKRKILLQRGGILPFLIPIICATIGAAGTVGAAAAGAAVMKS